MKRLFTRIVLGVLLLLALVSCGAILLIQRDSRNPRHLSPPKVAVLNCPDRPPTVSVTTAIQASAAHTIYVGSGGHLYALDAQTGVMRWCRQVAIVGDSPCSGSCPSPPSIILGEPAAADGAVYVCASGYGDGQTYAFDARDGALLWQSVSDCLVNPIFSGKTGAPLVGHGIVYSGSCALSARDGQVIWTTQAGHGGLRQPQYIAFQALADGVLYANDEVSIYAISTQDGSVRWKYTPPGGEPPSTRLVVAGGRLYYGTFDAANESEKSRLYVLDITNGSLLWRSSTPVYNAVAFANGLVYFGSENPENSTLYALQASNGVVRWHDTTTWPYAMAVTGTNDVVYAVMDGPYAFDAATGKMLWHQSLGMSEYVSFTPMAVVGDVVYLGRTDGGSGESTIYALNATTGAIYWQISGIQPNVPLVVG